MFKVLDAYSLKAGHDERLGQPGRPLVIVTLAGNRDDHGDAA